MPGLLTAKVAVVIVEASIGSLNEAVMTATFVAPFSGFVELTAGATVSPPGPAGLSESEPHPAIATSDAISEQATK
jgi:hypothetical protein